jgi:hypothetical protein
VGDEDYIQNLFLPGKNKFWMDDEFLGFSANIFTVLTINAISENQANRYMLPEKNLGLGNQDSCPWKECKTKKTTEFLRLFLMNWEAQTSAVGKSK